MLRHFNWMDFYRRPGMGNKALVMFVIFLVLLFASSFDEQLSPLFSIVLIAAFIALIIHFVRHLLALISDENNKGQKRLHR